MDFANYSRTFLHFYTQDIPHLLLKWLKNDETSLVDMGAGDGALLVALKLNGSLKNSKKVFAVDISEERCKRLREHTDFNVVCSDVTAIPELPTGQVDFVTCTQVIEHVDQDKLLAEIKRIMNPDATLYIASVVKKKFGWWYYKNHEGKWSLDPTHLREYASKEEYESVLISNGFKIQETVLTPLKLSIVEFLVRRVFCSVFKPETINTFFLRHRVANFFRRKLNIHPPGYYIIETIATLSF